MAVYDLNGKKLTREPDAADPDGRLPLLQIPAGEMTPAVTIAISALLEQLDDMDTELALSRKRLEELETLVDVDCLVPIPNRRAFMRRLQWAARMHDRYAFPISVLYFDLNNLKGINDTYGHQAGDAAIQHAVECIRPRIRESDYFARLGGDEFGVLFFNAREQDAEARAAIIAEALRNAPLILGDATLMLSAAWGVYALRKGQSGEEALALADKKMYAHKATLKASHTDVTA